MTHAPSHHSRFKGIIDTTLRDGEQSPLLFDSNKYHFSLEDKKAIINGLVQLGVRHLELFSPVVGKRQRTDFLAIKQYVTTISREKVHLICHARCDERDIEQALEAGYDGLNLYIGASDRAQKNSHGLSFDSILERASQILSSVRTQHPDFYIRFSVEDFFRTPIEETLRLYDTVAPYVNTFGMPDTVGIATPQLVQEAVQTLRARYSNHDIECHFHNDRGYSLINAVTAILAGASYIDTTIWGMAERSGITSLTGLLFNLYHENPELCQNYNLLLCYPLNVLMGSILNLHVPPTEPVSLTNRTHTAGVHQKAVLKDTTLYEAHDLARFGVTGHQLLLGPLSGWNLIYYYLREVKYVDVSPSEAKVIAQEFKQKTDAIHRLYSPDALLSDIVASHNVSPIMNVSHDQLERRIENLT